MWLLFGINRHRAWQIVRDCADRAGLPNLLNPETGVPVEDRTALLSDNGSGYLSRQFGDHLRLVGIRHIIASPYHPQTNGKVERYHRTVKGELSLLPYDMPSALHEAIRSFVENYNYQRYHESLKNVTPFDVYNGRYLEVLQRREAKDMTMQARKSYNSAVGGRTGLRVP